MVKHQRSAENEHEGKNDEQLGRHLQGGNHARKKQNDVSAKIGYNPGGHFIMVRDEGILADLGEKMNPADVGREIHQREMRCQKDW